MLEHYVGEPNFRKGLVKYLKDFKYKNAKGQDLWDAIGKASKMPVSSMVNSWLKQPGFPLVEIQQDDNNLQIKQNRYLLEPDKKSSRGLWEIPLVIGLPDNTITRLFSKKSMSLKIPKSTLGFVANYGRTGFYRVKYDEGILLDLKMLVDQKKILPIDRWAIQNDLFSLCVSGNEQVKDYLDFSDAYYEEDSYLSSINVAHNLSSLYFRAFEEKFSEEIRDYTVNYLRKVLFDLGWEPKKSDKHTDALLRSFAISALGKMDDEEVAQEAKKCYDKFLKSPKSLSPDLIEPICSIAAWNGNSKTYSELLKLYKNAKTMEEKLRFLGAMCGFQDQKLLEKTLNFSQTSEVRSQNMQLPIMKVASNPYGKKILWPWLKKNWKKLNKKVGHGNPLFNRIVASISLVADDSMEKEIKQFFKKNPTPGTERTQSQTLERIRINSKFLRSMQKEFRYG
jgi:tricorn protease interacting factor F2/3